jgi:hypothetical protein
LKVSCGLLLALIAFAAPRVTAQTEQTIGAAVTYISSGSTYINVGRERGLAQGDTVLLRRGASVRGRGVIIAVSSRSSAVHLLVPATGQWTNAIAVGDSAFVTKGVARAVEPTSTAWGPSVQSPPIRDTAVKPPAPSLSDVVSGRVALQYTQAGVPGAAPDLSQPSLYTRVNVARLFGTGMNLSFFARTYKNTAKTLYNDGGKIYSRIYDFSLSYEAPQGLVGWNAGRVTSVFMGGLGQVDGGQVYVRSGDFAFGVLGGFQPDYQNSHIDTRQQKAALFVHYNWEGRQFSRWDATVAYGRQWYDAKLDRDFLYVQNTARLGPGLFLYQSSEIDLHTMQGGDQKRRFQLTNTYITLTYVPLAWLNASAGFDATRNVYLLERMKWYPDTLVDHTLKEGYRGSLSFRIPFNIMLTVLGRFRPASGTERQIRSLGAGARISDLGGTGINVGAQYSDLNSVYTNGKDLTFDADDWVTRDLSLMLRYDRYAYTVLAQGGDHASTTGSVILQWRISRALFTLISYDKVWDSLRDSERLMCELSVRF